MPIKFPTNITVAISGQRNIPNIDIIFSFEEKMAVNFKILIVYARSLFSILSLDLHEKI
jgi:hypothetical protein